MNRDMRPSRSVQCGAVTLIAVILLITVITFSALVAALYSSSNVSDTLQQEDSVAALFLAESGLENAISNLSVSNTCDGTGVGAGTTTYGRGSFQIVSGTTVLTLCRITVRGTVSSVTRTIQADVRVGGGAITGPGTGCPLTDCSENSVNGNSLQLTVPTSVVSGNLLLAQITVRDGTAQTITAPAGWSLIPTNGRLNSGTTLAQAIYYRVAGASEPVSYTWGFTNSERAAGAMLRYSGVHTTTPIDVSNGQVRATQPVIAPSITTTVANTYLVGFFGLANGNATMSEPVGMTLRAAANSMAGPNGVNILVSDETRAATGATGTRSATSTNSTDNIGHLVALRPSGGIASVVNWLEP